MRVMLCYMDTGPFSAGGVGGGVEKQGRCMCGGVGCMWGAWGGMNSGVRVYRRDSLWQGECSGVALVGEGRGEGGVREEGATGELRHICSVPTRGGALSPSGWCRILCPESPPAPRADSLGLQLTSG